MRTWTEECRVYRHDQCQHIGSTSAVGLRPTALRDELSMRVSLGLSSRSSASVRNDEHLYLQQQQTATAAQLRSSSATARAQTKPSQVVSRAAPIGALREVWCSRTQLPVSVCTAWSIVPTVALISISSYGACSSPISSAEPTAPKLITTCSVPSLNWTTSPRSTRDSTWLAMLPEPFTSENATTTPDPGVRRCALTPAVRAEPPTTPFV